jgi:hypothetical protein
MSNPFESKAQIATTSTEPPAWQKPYIQAGLDSASKIYNNSTPEFYPGSTVAGFSPTQQTAMQMGKDRAIGGSEMVDQSKGYTSDVLSGNYLREGNPYMQDVTNMIKGQVLPAVNSQFALSGRHPGGSNQYADTVTKAMTSAMAPYAFQTYGAERQAMEDASHFAPQLAQNDWTDLGMLGSIGDAEQKLAQSEITDSANRWSYYQDLPANQLNQYLAQVSGGYGSTSQQPYYQPGWGTQLLGAGLATAGTAGKLGWSPFG